MDLFTEKKQELFFYIKNDITFVMLINQSGNSVTE